jgi:glutathione S-transferase
VITLYDDAFSPFAPKVRMVLEHKKLAFDAIDGRAAEARGFHEWFVRQIREDRVAWPRREP